MAKQSNTDEENKKLQEQIELLKQRNKLQQESFDLSSSVVDSLRETLGIEIRRSTMEKSTLKANQDINTATFGDYNWDDDGTAVNIAMTVQPDYCVLNY